MPVAARKLSQAEITSAVSYNKKNNQSICTKIQNLVGTTPDNAFGPLTVQAIANWQASKGLEVDGKFGPASKKAAGFTSGGSSNTTAASTTAASTTSYPTTSGSTKKLSQSQITAAITYNKNNNQSICTKIQELVGVTQDNSFGPITVQAIADWQASHGLEADGQFGPKSAAKAGITIPAQSETSSAPVGGGINAKPGFDKQYNYPNSPYVSKAHYNEMKSAMGDVPYSQWDINNSKISKIYARAKSANSGDKSTISSSGCGVTAYANLKKISPKTAAEMAMKGGHRYYNAGTSGNFFTEHGGQSSSCNNALEAVKKGKYAICCMNNTGNYWTTGGHYILLYGYDGTYVYVSDSASSASNRAKAKKYDFTKAYNYGYTFSS